MDAAAIDRALASCEAALAQRGRIGLGRLGFWMAVAAVKRERALIERYAERIARVDREAFVRATPLVMPAWMGVALGSAGTAAGVALVALAPFLPEALGARDRLPLAEIAYLAGAGALVGTTHSLAHWVVGRLVGIRFTHVFSKLMPPQPGFKTDYASYLRTPARSRAWMHASGALVSKVIPFLVAALAAARGAAPWAVSVLLALGILQLVTDVTLSTRASDWKRFRREMRFAR
ncbi:MAG: hypothetical protein FJ028_04390 [Chloroflexi bacterium]|nr:hypothetical protein [Chloroflexota bacterium]